MAGDLKTQIAVGVDGSGVTAGVEGIKKSLDTLGQKAALVGKQASDGIDSIGTGAAPTAAKVDAATKNMIGSIQRQIAVMEAGSKSGADYYRVLAGQRGIDTSALKPYLDQLDAITAKQKAAQAAMQGTAPALGQVGVSAAQTAAALRGVPAQFTDIITSLQGGQSAITVLLQQGGQLKDMFGGTGAAARALGGYVAGLISPLTLGGAALAAFALAAYQGSQEATAYSKALILTGNAAGKTVSDLQGMAVAIAQTNGTQGQAAAALAASVESGKIASSALESVGSAAVSMSRVLGVSIEDAVASFVKLADEPAKASAKLNEQYNYLSASTFQRIRDLEEQGRREEAAALAQTTYANATNERLRLVESQAGVLSRAWRMLGDDARKAWDLMQGIGRPQTTGEMLADAQQRLANRQARGALPGAGDSYAKGLEKDRAEVAALSRKLVGEQERAYAEGERSRAEAEKIAAIQRLADQKKATRSRADQRKDEIEQLDKDAKLLGIKGQDYADRLAAINEKYKDSKGAKPKAFQDDAGAKYLETLRQQGSVLQEQLSSTGKLTDAEREQAKFTQLVADLKGKDQLTAEQKSLLAARDKIAAQLQINVLTEREISFQKILADDAKRRADAEKATARAVTGNSIRIADGLDRQREQYDDRLGVVGLGSQAAEELRSRQQVEREYSRMQAQLTKTAAENATLEGEAYKQGTRDIAAAREQALGINEAYYARLRAMQGDWSVGASQALANYRNDAANVFQQTEQFGSNSLKGLEDVFANFATTGKLSFKSFANSVIADLARIQARSTVSSVAKLLGSALSNFKYSGSSTNTSAANYENSMDRGVEWADGGYTGPGGKYQAAGIVHAGEYVINAESTRKLGLDFLGRLNGYAAGGLVSAPPAMAAPNYNALAAMKSGEAGMGKIEVHVHSNGQAAGAQVTQSRTADGGLRVDVLLEQFEDALADRMGSGSGSLARAVEGRYGLRTAVS